MRKRAIKLAEHYGNLERYTALEKELLNINGIVSDRSDNGVCIDLDNFGDVFEIVILPKYDISVSCPDYFKQRNSLIADVIKLAEKYDLHKTEDRIEDYGEHLYFVFSCGKSWR